MEKTMQNINELARIVMPASDFLDYQELFINREESTCRLDGILKQVNIYKFNTWMNMFAAQKHYFYCDLPTFGHSGKIQAAGYRQQPELCL